MLTFPKQQQQKSMKMAEVSFSSFEYVFSETLNYITSSCQSEDQQEQRELGGDKIEKMG